MATSYSRPRGLGAIERRREHRRLTHAQLERIHDEAAPPSLAILVPAYREEPEVVRRTLISAAIQEHPRRRVVLLIDDSPHPADLEAAAALVALRRLPSELADLFEKPRRASEAALAEFEQRARVGELDRAARRGSQPSRCAEAGALVRGPGGQRAGRRHFRALVPRPRAARARPRSRATGNRAREAGAAQIRARRRRAAPDPTAVSLVSSSWRSPASSASAM
jgi:cellulose synthase/poly-beta-1,6-N-acetylglucosamine synthase-like glycosyltransferase